MVLCYSGVAWTAVLWGLGWGVWKGVDEDKDDISMTEEGPEGEGAQENSLGGGEVGHLG